MFPYLSLGPFLLQLPGLVLLAGVYLGLTLAEKEALRLKLDKDHITNLVFWGLVAGVLGARLAYAARFLPVYLEEPLSLLALNPQTLSPVDGVMIGILAASVYVWRRQLPVRPTLDALAPGLAAFLIAIAVSHLLSGDAFGSPTNLPWAIYLWDENRHPTQVYEILLALGVLWVVLKRPWNQPGAGLNFLLAVSLASASRLFLEAFRGDSLIWPGGWRAAQVISLAVLLLSLWLMPQWAVPSPEE